MQRSRQPRGDDFPYCRLAPVVEMVAVRDDLHGARASGAGLEVFGGVVLARFLVAADVEGRAFDLRGEREAVGRLGEAGEVSLPADRRTPAPPPPSRPAW